MQAPFACGVFNSIQRATLVELNGNPSLDSNNEFLSKSLQHNIAESFLATSAFS
jgi:hypothetical protein